MIQLSHPYMTAGKIIALTIWTFVGKMVSLLFNTLFSFIIAFLPKSKCLLISWLQSPPTVFQFLVPELQTRVDSYLGFEICPLWFIL